MPWQVSTVVDKRLELVQAIQEHGERVGEVSRRFQVSRQTAFKWMKRFDPGDLTTLEDRSRRPHVSPSRTASSIEEQVCELRRRYPTWGGRKLHHRLKALGIEEVPSPSTITDILARHGLLPEDRRRVRDTVRFEADRPNRMWQMDYKGDFALLNGRCYILTILDDHSRFNLSLEACGNQRSDTLKDKLLPVFATYGLPDTILVDNGPPWGSGWSIHPYTHFSAWLIRQGIYVSHGRPYHPQTRGKDERFHRSLGIEVLRGTTWLDLRQVQTSLDAWRQVYNFERPHEALAYTTPAERYRRSSRGLPSDLPAIEYPGRSEVRKVQQAGEISFRGREFSIGRAFAGEPVALRESEEDGVWNVYYCHQRVGRADLRSTPPPGR